MKIVFLDSYTLVADGLSLSPLESLGEFIHYDRTPPDLVLDRARDADVIITNKVVLNKEILIQLDQLKLVAVAATGFNNVDVQFAKERGIPVVNVAGYSTLAVAQQVFAHILNVVNRISIYNDQVHAGHWANQKDFSFYHHPIHDLADKILGIYGLGTIGIEVAKIGHAFGMQIIGYNRSGNAFGLDYIQMVDLDQLFETSDFLTLHAPLNDSSKGIINRNVLESMKKSSVLINTARGPLIQEHDLATALKNKTIAFACLDVLSKEPPETNHPLFGIEQCIITPHQAWASRESRERLLSGLVENIQSFKNGKLIHVVNEVTASKNHL